MVAGFQGGPASEHLEGRDEVRRPDMEPHGKLHMAFHSSVYRPGDFCHQEEYTVEVSAECSGRGTI